MGRCMKRFRRDCIGSKSLGRVCRSAYGVRTMASDEISLGAHSTPYKTDADRRRVSPLRGDGSMAKFKLQFRPFYRIREVGIAVLVAAAVIGDHPPAHFKGTLLAGLFREHLR